jgi:hypothetical protein
MTKKSYVVIAVILSVLGIQGCRDGDDYKTVSVVVKNSTDRTLTVHYQKLSWTVILGSALADEEHDIGSLDDYQFTAYYLDVPDIHVTGSGVDVWFNALLYQGDRYTVRQSDVVEGDG